MKPDTIESAVLNTIKKYKLIGKNDRVVAAVSGGKDSTTVLHILNKYFLNVEAITINAFIGNYSKQNLENIQSFCGTQEIPLHTISFREEFGRSLCHIQSLLKSKGINLNSCAVCGVLKRYLLNKKARELGKTVLVTGHTLDDEAQSVLMNLLRGSMESLAKLGPITGVVAEKKFIKRVKPLYFISEKQTEAYSKSNNFPVLYGRCPCAVDAYRNTVRSLLNSYELRLPRAKQNIITFFLKVRPKLKAGFKTSEEVGYCTSCGEPSMRKMCKTCEILSAI